MSPAPGNPYSFVDANGFTVDWSNIVGEVFPNISMHDRPITKAELALICARKSRECALVQAITAMRLAGETDKALLLAQLNLCL
jgi:hypothetical protein